MKATTNEIDFDAIRADRAALVEVLTGAGAKFKGTACPCIFHEDKSASAGIHQGEDGGWRFKCHAGGCGVAGDLFDMRAKLNGTSRADEIKAFKSDNRLSNDQGAKVDAQASKPDPEPRRAVYKTREALKAAAERSDRDAGGKLQTAYAYRDASGKPYLCVLRLERADGSKTFRQCTHVDGGWIMKSPPKPYPLFNLASLIERDRCVVVEGEKAASKLHGIGVCATTAAGGAGKASSTDWTPLGGMEVYLWPDADPADEKTGKRAGIEHMADVRRILEALPNPPKAIYWIDPDRLDLPAKGDAFDFIEHHGAYAKDLVVEVLEQAKPTGPLADLHAMLDDAKAGRRYAIPMPWLMLSKRTRALLYGAVMILCGSPGATKSLALVQLLRYIARQGHRVAALMLEDGRGYHLRRALAQISGNSNVTDDDWCKEHPGELDAAELAARDELLALQHCIHALPDNKPPTPDNLLAWIQTQADAGARVIAVDPITLMQKGPKSWTDDEKFLGTAKRIVEKAGASLVLVSHPRRLPHGARPASLSMDDLSGGAVYARASQTILYLRAHDTEAGTVATTCGNIDARWNRTVTVFKARNGKGCEGQRFAYYFDGGTLTLHERGQIAN